MKKFNKTQRLLFAIAFLLYPIIYFLSDYAEIHDFVVLPLHIIQILLMIAALVVSPKCKIKFKQNIKRIRKD